MDEEAGCDGRPIVSDHVLEFVSILLPLVHEVAKPKQFSPCDAADMTKVKMPSILCSSDIS